MVGKYVALQDAYISITESLRHAAVANEAELEIKWVNAEEIEAESVDMDKVMEGVNGILVPGGFTFEKGKHAKYHKVKPDAKHDEWRATGEFETIPSAVDVTLNDGENYPEPAPTAKNAKVTLNRTFYKNYWNAICLPYSINRRQIEKVFGDGTMVVLMNYIDTSNKKVMFIEHANQDIIAGYPYLIFPTTKADTEKKDHTDSRYCTRRRSWHLGCRKPDGRVWQ